MTSQTNEQALESSIEKCLTGTCLEEIKESGYTVEKLTDNYDSYRGGHGYYVGSSYNFNARYAIEEHRFWSFMGKVS